MTFSHGIKVKTHPHQAQQADDAHDARRPGETEHGYTWRQGKATACGWIHWDGNGSEINDKSKSNQMVDLLNLAWGYPCFPR